MNTLRTALSEAAKENPNLANMVKTAEKKLDRRKRRKALTPQQLGKRMQKAHDSAIQKAMKPEFGLWGMQPASLLKARPGRNVLAHGCPAKIICGLTDGENELVIVKYALPQPLKNNPAGKHTLYGVALPQDLKPCNCRGFIHRNCGRARKRRAKFRSRGSK